MIWYALRIYKNQHIWLSNRDFRVPNASLRNIKVVNIGGGPRRAGTTMIQRDPSEKIKKGRLIKILTLRPTYEVVFDIKPMKRSPKWGNVMLYGSLSKRLFGVWLKPGSLQLHIDVRTVCQIDELWILDFLFFLCRFAMQQAVIQNTICISRNGLMLVS